MQRMGDRGEAMEKQRNGDEGKECPGLDHPGQSKKEWPKRKDCNKRGNET